MPALAPATARSHGIGLAGRKAAGHRAAVRNGLLFPLLIAAGACGAKTGLDEQPTDGGTAPRPADAATTDDASPRDAGPRPRPRPTCLEVIPAGEVRGTIAEIDARPAYDADGNLYAPREVSRRLWQLVSYDACLRERWVVPLPGFEAREGMPRTSVDGDGRVWVKNQRSLARASLDGDLVEKPLDFDYEGDLWTWVAAPPNGPVFATYVDTEETYLYRLLPAGAGSRVRLPMPSSFVYDGECLWADDAALCWNVAYEGRSLRQRYLRDPPRLVDGTFRHLTQVAFDGERLWSLRFGISTYDLVGQDAQTGHEVATARIATTTRGQSETIMSPPVIAAGGEVLVYFTGARSEGSPGQLQAFDADGRPLWSFPAQRSRTRNDVFDALSMIAVGDANVAYLAVGETVHAVNVADGTERWVSFGFGEFNDPDMQISPFGDIAIRNSDRTLVVIATESRAPARSPWPVAGGDPGATYAR